MIEHFRTSGLATSSLLLAAGAGLAPSPGAQSIEVPLEYHADTQGYTSLYVGGHASVSPLDACPEGEWKLPELRGEAPRFGLLTLGDSTFLLVLDRRAADSAFYDRLHLDANGNRDLTDDATCNGQIVSQNVNAGLSFYYVSFDDGLDLEYRLGDATLRYHAEFTVQGGDPAKTAAPAGMEGMIVASFHIMMRSTCFYAGQFARGEKTYQVAVSDQNGNGRYDDPLAIDPRIQFAGRGVDYPEGDGFYLTAEKDLSYRDLYPLGSRLLIGETLFDMRIDVAARKLVLAPAAGERGTLRFALPPERLVLEAKEGGSSVMLHHPGPQAALPAGTYRLLSYQARTTGAKGDEWLLSAGGTRRTPWVTVAPGTEAALAFGPPFTALAEVDDWSAKSFRGGNADEVRISFNVEGVASELLTDLRKVGGDASSVAMSTAKETMPAEPSYTVLTSAGEKVTSGTFEYG
ncbi:MAG: hypothetical protein AB1726_09825 [Planctomycetota bacterium]